MKEANHISEHFLKSRTRECVLEMHNCIPAVQAEFTEPAEIIASGGNTFLFVKISTRRGANSSFCSRCPSLQNF